MAGILTKTVIRSPVVRWILQAQVRRKDCNDVALIGDDFVHIKQVGEYGHLDHVATKSNFDSCIRAAAVFTFDHSRDADDVFMKIENETAPSNGVHDRPPQFLVLALESSELLFIHLEMDQKGDYHFIHQSFPLPRFDRMLLQLGEHLSIDPHSRAISVAASEREVIIYATRPAYLHDGVDKSMPLFTQRPIQVDGVIQHMDFLKPSADDEGHIILLLIVADQRRTKAVWVDWYADADLHQAQIHNGQTLAIGETASSLLIPLRNAAFILITGASVILWTDLLCGSAVSKSVLLTELEPEHPGASSREPIWVNYCRPRRAKDDGLDHIYLVREDGKVLLLEASPSKVISCHAGDFECHVGSAFASLGGTRDPDILIAAGDMSSGRIYSIGHWSSIIRVPEMERSETMQMQLIETLPNWASVTDMVTSTLPGKTYRARDGIFVTSGRQPYGAITELRQGLEARLLAYFELEGLRAVTDVWALPLSVGRVLIVLATPSETRLLDVPAIVDSAEELDGAAVGFDDSSQTLAAAATEKCQLIQVTRRSICISPGLYPNFEDASRFDCDGTTVVAAAIDAGQFLIITAERSDDGSSQFALRSYVFGSNDEDAMDMAHIQAKARQNLEEEPLCLNILTQGARVLVFIATSGGMLQVFELKQDKTFTALYSRPIAHLEPSGPSMCDSMAILSPPEVGKSVQLEYQVVCGLRDGSLHVARLDLAEGLSFREERTILFGRSNVKLVQPSSSSSSAYATSGMDTCLLSWDERNSSSHSPSVRIENIWISDKQRPDLAQNLVTACTHMPPTHLLSSPNLADSLILLSGDEFSVTTLDHTVGPVPRQIPVSGTPNRLIYTEQQRCLVCASLRYEAPPSLHPRAEQKRQIFPVIDFIPTKDGAPSYSYEMHPGERVHTLLEWSYKSNDDKVYSFVLVGGSYTRSSGSIRGRITFLQPVNRNWSVVDIKEPRKESFAAPVYALALLDEITYVASVGSEVLVLRYAVDERKWEQICAPFRLSSPGVYITTSFQTDSEWTPSPFQTIHISTLEDSMVVLDLGPMMGAQQGSYSHAFISSTTSPRADALVSHCALEKLRLNLATTKQGKILGLKNASPQSSTLEFEACLPRSLTRIRQCNIRPPWKQSPTLLETNTTDLIGSTTDGTLIGLKILDETLLARLNWLQRLCEWDADLSPHSHHFPAYTISEQTYARNERAMPVGFGGERGEIVMRTSRSRLQDRHVDGDVLARLFEGSDVVGRVRGLVKRAAERRDRVGEWMRAHLEAEMEGVEEVVRELREVLDGWL